MKRSKPSSFNNLQKRSSLQTRRNGFWGLIFILSACGGEVHFVNGQKEIETPPPALSRTIVENFRYAESSGTQILAFVLDSRNSNAMRNIREKLQQNATAFSNSYWRLSDHLEGVHFVITRDIGP